MSGKVISLGVNSIVNYVYDRGWRFPPKLDVYRLPKDNTYITIFGPAQQGEMKKFKEAKHIDILFESMKAVNKNNGHGEHPRNTLFIYEMKDDEQQVGA